MIWTKILHCRIRILEKPVNFKDITVPKLLFFFVRFYTIIVPNAVKMGMNSDLTVYMCTLCV